jgi:hypothetical protein
MNMFCIVVVVTFLLNHMGNELLASDFYNFQFSKYIANVGSNRQIKMSKL